MPTNDWFANLRDPLGRRARNDGARGRYAIRCISLKVQLDLRPEARTQRSELLVPTIWLVEVTDEDTLGLTSSNPEFRITGLTGAFTTYVRLEDAVGAVLRHEQPGWAFAVHQLDRMGRPKDRPV